MSDNHHLLSVSFRSSHCSLQGSISGIFAYDTMTETFGRSVSRLCDCFV